MMLTSLGDQASSLSFLRNSSALKQTIGRLTDELATGVTSDVHARLGGNYAYLSDIQSGLMTLEGYAIAANEAATTATAMQASLTYVNDIASALSASLLTGGSNTVDAVDHLNSGRAAEDLEALMATLNTAVAGRSLFSGTTVDTKPLASSTELLDGLRTALTGLTDPADIRTAAEAWFAPGGGFETTIYQGGTSDLSATRISDTVQVSLSVRADDTALRDLMRETALAALADDATLGLSEADANTVRNDAGAGLHAALGGLVTLQATLGRHEAQIEDALSENASRQLSLEASRSSLLAVDAFETATGLEDAQFRLEALFAVAARSASLSLVNYL